MKHVPPFAQGDELHWNSTIIIQTLIYRTLRFSGRFQISSFNVQHYLIQISYINGLAHSPGVYLGQYKEILNFSLVILYQTTMQPERDRQKVLWIVIIRPNDKLWCEKALRRSCISRRKKPYFADSKVRIKRIFSNFEKPFCKIPSVP